MFFQKNNFELYEELVRIKEKYTKEEGLLAKANEEFQNSRAKI